VYFRLAEEGIEQMSALVIQPGCRIKDQTLDVVHEGEPGVYECMLAGEPAEDPVEPKLVPRFEVRGEKGRILVAEREALDESGSAAE
jgi:hypothetical protein